MHRHILFDTKIANARVYTVYKQAVYVSKNGGCYTDCRVGNVWFRVSAADTHNDYY